MLAHLTGPTGPTGHVTTIDVDDDIVDGARTALAAVGIDNVTVILGDGALGHADNAPYDRIIATVSAHAVPHAWLDQLAPGGRLLTPLRLRGTVARSIAFEPHDGAWRSVSSEMNTFMPLRQGIADDPRRLVPLTRDGTVTLVTSGGQEIDAEALSDVLHQPTTQVWTGPTFRGQESAEWLGLWLACTMPSGLNRMPAKPQAIESGLLSAPYPSSTACFDQTALTSLTRRKASHTASDGAGLYEFGVIGHGPGGDTLAEQVADAVRTWTAITAAARSSSRSSHSTTPRPPDVRAASPSPTPSTGSSSSGAEMDVGLIAHRFPLVARPRPACPPLVEWIAQLRDMAHTAHTDGDRTLAAAVQNKAALIAATAA
ncbi:hypothetical protein ACFQHO_09550 [Actinomadura yumaensis]|uniref:hypothetical protein n=1 Tax=Actinomadura yumaensis TaxID=111807 RepID=UPI00361C6117